MSAEDLPARLAEIRAIGADALLGVDGCAALRFRNDDATRTRLEAIVAAESECCSFLGFDLRTDGEQLELRITAPVGGEALADELVRAFAEGARAGARTARAARGGVEDTLDRFQQLGLDPCARG